MRGNNSFVHPFDWSSAYSSLSLTTEHSVVTQFIMWACSCLAVIPGNDHMEWTRVHRTHVPRVSYAAYMHEHETMYSQHVIWAVCLVSVQVFRSVSGTLTCTQASIAIAIATMHEAWMLAGAVGLCDLGCVSDKCAGILKCIRNTHLHTWSA